MVYVILIMILIVIATVLSRNREPQEQEQPQPDRPELSRRHRQARDYILESGDVFAINELRQIEHRPEAYNYYFNKYADRNRTLKIALGLVAGYLTWELLNDDSRETELAAAMECLDKDLENDSVLHEDDIVEGEKRAQGIIDDDSDYGEDQLSEAGEVQKLYDLDDTQYFEDMMDG